MTVRSKPAQRAAAIALAITAIVSVMAALGALDLLGDSSSVAPADRPPANFSFFSVSLA